MTLNSLKYIAILIALLALYIILPIGDYQSGIAHALWFFILSVLFLILSLIVIITKLVKRNKNFDYTMTFVTAAFLLICYFNFSSAHNKFWTKSILNAQTDSLYSREISLTLYKNNSFEICERHLEFIKVYQGDYTISNDTLYLLKEGLPKLTNNLITNKYLVKDTILKPLNAKYPDIAITKE